MQAERRSRRKSPYDLAEHAAQEALSPLEVRVLRLIANGYTNKEIAAKLSVTEEAIKSQVRRSCRSWARTTARMQP